MGDDEAGTLTALKTLRRELVKPKETQYGGRTVKLMGDGALMEFASVVDAVTFAAEVQVAIAERNEEVPEDRQIVYRMGINIGDITIIWDLSLAGCGKRRSRLTGDASRAKAYRGGSAAFQHAIEGGIIPGNH